MTGARELVLKGLYRIEKDGAYSNKVLTDILRTPGLSEQDRAFANALLMGVVGSKLKLDYIIQLFSRIKLKKLSLWVLLILRMGVYQLTEMEHIPDRAACSESMHLAEKYAHKAARGYINGVLRSIAREKGQIVYPEEISERFSVLYSCPLWLTRKLLDQYGEEGCKKILCDSHIPHPVTLRVNRLKTTPKRLIGLLLEEGVTTREIGENCLKAESALDIRRSPAYAQGLYTLQNTSSMEAVRILNPQPGETILDICAAPGGKTGQIAEIMDNRGRVLAFDLHPHKIQLIEKTMQRLGVSCVEASIWDARHLMPQWQGKADRVLADVPCSGIGVMHKKPDIKWKRQESDIPELCTVQADILDTACRYVKPGGVLEYATCTILKEENEEQVAAFLNRNKTFRLDKEKQILAHETGGSGFYIAKMVCVQEK
ncbi:16S rRNA (cytosine(967)-C(5))-methyltransferase RsmB [Ructibacterium gallinarum]|uniref:16S rRNA (cytosine(967)-C(5))-methyltransferase n=1 Tax=Ructibacterium gallinarum TaxID=2779355 RepID=A0A9D5M167_9FIRM|nr:16S rRNA (cytosine(967)-C(5))-methyltransferase RsmB [Ructibacterium gallinarum]MBE5039548.1 16S rRNA (cytosine(967)-C(5))-methyltransferase RsmB [Ructibacterium gallinarum]